MLIRYKKSFKKIAMGLLSYMPHEKELKTLQETIDCYEGDEHRQLFLWKSGDDLVAVAGIYVEEEQATLMHIAVNPSFRNEGIGTEMVLALEKLYKDCSFGPNESTKRFYENAKRKAGHVTSES